MLEILKFNGRINRMDYFFKALVLPVFINVLLYASILYFDSYSTSPLDSLRSHYIDSSVVKPSVSEDRSFARTKNYFFKKSKKMEVKLEERIGLTSFMRALTEDLLEITRGSEEPTQSEIDLYKNYESAIEEKFSLNFENDVDPVFETQNLDIQNAKISSFKENISNYFFKIFVFLVDLLVIWIVFVSGIKRIHDFGRSGFYFGIPYAFYILFGYAFALFAWLGIGSLLKIKLYLFPLLIVLLCYLFIMFYIVLLFYRGENKENIYGPSLY